MPSEPGSRRRDETGPDEADADLLPGAPEGGAPLGAAARGGQARPGGLGAWDDTWALRGEPSPADRPSATHRLRRWWGRRRS